MRETRKQQDNGDATTQIVMVLDRSGSMAVVRDQTIESFNRFIADQRRQAERPESIFISLAQFDSEYEVVYENVPLISAPRLTHETYTPRWSTALLDAIGLSTNAMLTSIQRMAEADRPAYVIFVILTDGLENASCEFTPAMIKRLIKERERDEWTYLFLGASQDAILSARHYGLHADRALSVARSQEGFDAAMHAVSDVVASRRCGNAFPNFYRRDRVRQRQLGAHPDSMNADDAKETAEESPATEVREGEWT